MPVHWRRLYTDAVILRVLAVLKLDGIDRMDRRGAEKAVRQLDLTLVVAGAPGLSRAESVHSLIKHIQQTFLPSATSTSPRPAKRARLASSPFQPPPLAPPHLDSPLRRFASAPSLDRFIQLLHDNPEPFVITGGCSDWPAVSLWTKEYLAQRVGPGRCVPVEAGGDYTKRGWGQAIVPFQTFLDRLDCAAGEDHADAVPKVADTADHATLPPASVPLYLAQHDLFRQFPSLLPDLLISDYVYACPSPPDSYPTYTPPGNEDGYVLNGWLGPRGTVSPAHTDPYFNLFAQVVGRKWVWCAPPGVGEGMSAFGQEKEGEHDADPDSDSDGGAAQLMTNTTVSR